MLITDRSYTIRFSFWATVGALFAAIPPLILDPKLVHHFRYGVRHYEHPVWLILICVGTLIFTFVLTAIKATRQTLAYPLLPLGTALFAMLPLLRPEMPHGNVVMVGTTWVLVLFVWHWIHVRLDVPSERGVLSDEYLKEEILFCRSLLLGFVAAYLSLFITALTALHVSNLSVAPVTAPSELFLLGKYSDLQISVISLLFFFGPVQESLQKLRQFMALLRDQPFSDRSGPALEDKPR